MSLNINNESRRIILVGRTPPPIGGATVLFADLVKACDVFSVPHRVLDFNKYGLIGALIISLLSRNAIIFLNLSSNRIFFVSVFLLFSRIFGKKVVFRGYGGSWDSAYNELPEIKKKMVISQFAKADLLCFETKGILDFFDKKLCSDNVYHLPNTRLSSGSVVGHQFADIAPDCGRCYRVCYVGAISKEKGIDVLVNMASLLDGAVSIELIGKPDAFGLSVIEAKPKNVIFHGEVSPNSVMENMSQFDAFIFPTRYKGEGYPGVILEAIQVGLPVIASNWRFIPELLNYQSEALFEIDNVDDAVEKLLAVLTDAVVRDRVLNEQRKIMDSLDARIIYSNLFDVVRCIKK